ncbi:hypothetical protein KL86DPRO_70115 [uncultured delta proteobacterium]|uniref:Transposase n=1 Tax=uncultured delta proteobacterium TaxID=34034 RepID=A0A212KGW4_9DELT|nr:hypothetical protein KL86DPRO_70115 [uncultured delta proteobacterium]
MYTFSSLFYHRVDKFSRSHLQRFCKQYEHIQIRYAPSALQRRYETFAHSHSICKPLL